jgi:pimeloyl-ACP methyl ester carboxylesterase
MAVSTGRKLMIAVPVLLAVLAAVLWTPDLDRATLEHSYLQAPADMVQVAGQALHVRVSGPSGAPAVIFLHGFGASLQTWEPWAQELGDQRRVVRVDLPGFGLSPPDVTGDYSDARSIRLLLALMDQSGLQRASLVGNSMGGRIAWTLAALYPKRVDKLVLISPDGFASPGFDYGKPPEVGLMVQAMRFTLPRWLLRMSLAPAYANPATMTDELATRYHDLMLAPGSRAAIIARMQQMRLVDPVPLLRRIEAPTLLMWGEQDAMIPITNADDYLKAVPHIRLLRLPGVGHLPQEEAPAQTLPALKAFLDETALQQGASP